MIIPIRCISCHKVLADKYQYYKKKCTEQEDTKEESKHFNVNFKKDILDELGLTRYCCRRVFLGHVDLIDEL